MSIPSFMRSIFEITAVSSILRKPARSRRRRRRAGSRSGWVLPSSTASPATDSWASGCRLCWRASAWSSRRRHGQPDDHLPARFQEAVDRAAMRAGKGSSDAYLADWKRSEPRPCAEDIQAAVAAVAAEIEARYTDEE